MTPEPTPPTPSLVERFGRAARPERPPAHPRPDGVTDDLAEALGKLGEALETAEHARGHLYAFHRLSGATDLTLQEAVSKLRDAGATTLADDVESCLVGRDVIADMWTFQLVERYDRDYLEVFRAADRHVRAAFDAPPHLFEAEMKHREQQGRVT